MVALVIILLFLLICVLYASIENNRKANQQFYEQIQENLKNISEKLKE